MKKVFCLLAALLHCAAHGAQASKPVHVFDLWEFFEKEKIEDTLDRADFVYLITALQGIVNREEPQLYLLASLSLFDIEALKSTRKIKELEVTELDKHWLEHLIERGDVDEKSLRRTDSLKELLEVFADQLGGLALWEMQVPATVNAALAAASTRNLLPVSTDLGSGKLRAWLATHADALQVRLDYSGKFQRPDKGKTRSVHGVEFTSSGNAKTDVYHYIRAAYLESKEASPFYIYFNSDAIMWGARRKMYAAEIYGHLGDRNELQQNGMYNNDYWVAKRGLFIDLYVWDDHAPNDDPGQPLGADWHAWNDLLETSYAQRKGEFGVVGGFVPWWIKYADEKHDGVSTEWRFIDLMTSYNMANDADAAFGLSNASFFMHLPAVEREKIPAPPTQFPELEKDTVYLAFFMLDYDGSAWLNQAAEAIYDAGGRGRVPLNWAINPVLNDRVPHAYRHMVESRTDLDFFGIEDDGVGYISPLRLIPGKRIGRIQESGIPHYERYAKQYHERFGISLTAFYVTPDYDKAWGEMAARLTPAGFGLNIPSPALQVEGTPMMTLESFHVNEVKDLGLFVKRLYRESAEGQVEQTLFYPVRCILYPPYAIADIVDAARAQYPQAKVQVVDAFTFYHLRKEWLKTTLQSPYRDVSAVTAAPGEEKGLRTVVSNVTKDNYGRFEVSNLEPAAWILRGGADRSRIFFQVDPAFGQEHHKMDSRVRVDYVDGKEGELKVQYVRENSEGSPTFYMDARPLVALTGDGERKTAEFMLKAAHFVGGMHHRSDFCVTAPEGVQILSVTLETDQ